MRDYAIRAHPRLGLAQVAVGDAELLGRGPAAFLESEDGCFLADQFKACARPALGGLASSPRLTSFARGSPLVWILFGEVVEIAADFNSRSTLHLSRECGYTVFGRYCLLDVGDVLGKRGEFLPGGGRVFEISVASESSIVFFVAIYA